MEIEEIATMSYQAGSDTGTPWAVSWSGVWEVARMNNLLTRHN